MVGDTEHLGEVPSVHGNLEQVDGEDVSSGNGYITTDGHRIDQAVGRRLFGFVAYQAH
jgi:hypothetical protein